MRKIIFCFAIFGSVAAGFVILPTAPRTSRCMSLLDEEESRNTIDKQERVLEGLHKEYNDLQQALQNHEDDKAQAMMEQMVDAVAKQRYQQMDVLDQAEKELAHARNDFERAGQLKTQAHDEAMSVEHETALLESMEDAYDDLERARDMSVVHADRQLEEDAEILELQSRYHQDLAEEKHKRALQLLKELQEYEDHLKGSLKQMRKMKNEQLVKEWKEKKATEPE